MSQAPNHPPAAPLADNLVLTAKGTTNEIHHAPSLFTFIASVAMMDVGDASRGIPSSSGYPSTIIQKGEQPGPHMTAPVKGGLVEHYQQWSPCVSIHPIACRVHLGRDPEEVTGWLHHPHPCRGCGVDIWREDQDLLHSGSTPGKLMNAPYPKPIRKPNKGTPSVNDNIYREINTEFIQFGKAFPCILQENGRQIHPKAPSVFQNSM